MNIAEKVELIADEVYAKGVTDSEVDFWKGFTNEGKRQNYYYAFLNTNFAGVTIPEGMCRPRSRVGCMFYQYYGATLPQGVDCSSFDTSLAADYHAQGMFAYSAVTEIYDVGLPVQKSYTQFARSCRKLVTIEVMRSDVNTVWNNNTFEDCNELVNLTIEGEIGQNGFNVSYSPNLTHDSLMSIIDALKTTSTTLTVTLGTANLNKLTDEEKAKATRKGWTLA